MAQRRMLARKREMRRPTQTGRGSSGSQSQGALNLEKRAEETIKQSRTERLCNAHLKCFLETLALSPHSGSRLSPGIIHCRVNLSGFTDSG